jgi:hypothetical protein
VRAEEEEKKSWFHRLLYPLSVRLPISAVAVLFLTVTVYYIYSGMNPADKYAEAPMGRLAKEAPAVRMDAAKQREPEITGQKENKVAQEPGYKSLDMKYEYEKPAPPVPAAPGEGLIASREEPAASAAPVRRAAPQPGKDEASREQRPAAPRAAVPSMMAEQAAPAAEDRRSVDKLSATSSKSTADMYVAGSAKDVNILRTCKADPRIIGECFTIHGRLGLSNGTPSIRIWQIGTINLFGVNSITHSLYHQKISDQDPMIFERHLTWDQDIFGDYLVCPLTHQKPDTMQIICIESAANISIKKKGSSPY